MSQPGMRVTVDAAMRARDVSRPGADDAAGHTDDGRESGSTDGRNPEASGSARKSSRPKSAKGERRRLGKRQAAARRRDDQGAEQHGEDRADG
jgi:hypothetical protein